MIEPSCPAGSPRNTIWVCGEATELNGAGNTLTGAEEPGALAGPFRTDTAYKSAIATGSRDQGHARRVKDPHDDGRLTTVFAAPAVARS